MKMDQAKELLEVIAAASAGKTIQQQMDDGSWEDMADSTDLHPDNIYRVKPDGKYRFFKDSECADVVGSVIRFPATEEVYVISGYMPGQGFYLVNPKVYHKPQSLLTSAVFHKTGRPFGKPINE